MTPWASCFFTLCFSRSRLHEQSKCTHTTKNSARESVRFVVAQEPLAVLVHVAQKETSARQLSATSFLITGMRGFHTLYCLALLYGSAMAVRYLQVLAVRCLRARPAPSRSCQ